MSAMMKRLGTAGNVPDKVNFWVNFCAGTSVSSVVGLHVARERLSPLEQAKSESTLSKLRGNANPEKLALPPAYLFGFSICTMGNNTHGSEHLELIAS
jgi:hypothetical protein